jgi:cytochrome b involved in lipid metabolism
MSPFTSALAKALLIPIAAALAFTATTAEASASAPSTSAVVAVGSATTVHTLAVKKYKMSTVKKHNKKSSCWVVISKNVYNLTGFIKKHPGGAKRIIAICGKDATKAFRNQHGTGGRPNAVLKTYKIGVLA